MKSYEKIRFSCHLCELLETAYKILKLDKNMKVFKVLWKNLKFHAKLTLKVKTKSFYDHSREDEKFYNQF